MYDIEKNHNYSVPRYRIVKYLTLLINNIDGDQIFKNKIIKE
jgi:hypothetical protein